MEGNVIVREVRGALSPRISPPTFLQPMPLRGQPPLLPSRAVAYRSPWSFHHPPPLPQRLPLHASPSPTVALPPSRLPVSAPIPRSPSPLVVPQVSWPHSPLPLPNSLSLPATAHGSPLLPLKMLLWLRILPSLPSLTS